MNKKDVAPIAIAIAIAAIVSIVFIGFASQYAATHKLLVGLYCLTFWSGFLLLERKNVKNVIAKDFSFAMGVLLSVSLIIALVVLPYFVWVFFGVFVIVGLWLFLEQPFDKTCTKTVRDGWVTYSYNGWK